MAIALASTSLAKPKCLTREQINGLFVHWLGCGTVLKYFFNGYCEWQLSYHEKSNPKCFRKWDIGFGSEPSSFNYKEIIYYIISHSC